MPDNPLEAAALQQALGAIGAKLGGPLGKRALPTVFAGAQKTAGELPEETWAAIGQAAGFLVASIMQASAPDATDPAGQLKDPLARWLVGLGLEPAQAQLAASVFWRDQALAFAKSVPN